MSGPIIDRGRCYAVEASPNGVTVRDAEHGLDVTLSAAGTRALIVALLEALDTFDELPPDH